MLALAAAIVDCAVSRKGRRHQSTIACNDLARRGHCRRQESGEFDLLRPGEKPAHRRCSVRV